jgi:hypothetical protein
VAREVAAGLADRHRAELAGVLPVSGLLAETARTGRISESLASRLAGLAGEETVALSLRRQDPDLQDLFRHFGPYGVTAGRGRALGGAAQLKSWCESISGVQDLEQVVCSRLVPRADLLKAIRALGVLRSLAGRRGSVHREQALSLVESAELDPTLHPLAELRALHTVTSQVPASPAAGPPPSRRCEEPLTWTSRVYSCGTLTDNGSGTYTLQVSHSIKIYPALTVAVTAGELFDAITITW